jgi:hypothetical protein
VATPAGDDHFSIIKSGFLRITGFLVKILLVPGSSKRGGIGVQLYTTNGWVGAGTSDIDLRLSNSNHDVAWWMPLVARDNAAGEEEPSSPTTYLFRLVLKPTMRGKGQDQRCGIFRVMRANSYKAFMETIERMIRKQA